MLERRDFTDSRLAALASKRPLRMLPNAVVLKLGGQSIIDRGAAAVLPLLDVIVAARPGLELIICTGGGTRARHAYQLGLELGLPSGVLARLGASVAKQNARMIQMLLAGSGAVHVTAEQLDQLPAFLGAGQLPILAGMPPYGYWTTPPAVGRIPEFRTDAGTFLLAEVLGARRAILVKDEDGPYTADPKKDPAARPLGHVSTAELRRLDLPDLIVERCLLDLLEGARLVREVTIVNGLEPQQLAAALAGQDAGVRIYG